MASGVRSKKRALGEWLETRRPAVIAEAEWAQLLHDLAPVSERYLRELLRGTGVAIEQPWAGVSQKTFAELEASLKEMLEVYRKAMAAGDRALARYCRQQVIGAKDHARLAARNPKTADHKRAEKEEMVEWMLVWLSNPEVFPSWVEIRKRAAGMDEPGGA